MVLTLGLCLKNSCETDKCHEVIDLEPLLSCVSMHHHISGFIKDMLKLGFSEKLNSTILQLAGICLVYK